MAKYYREIINAAAKTAPDIFVTQCDDNYRASISTCVNLILDKSKKIILLAGPSSSGKTTTAKMIVNGLEKKGCAAYLVSLDDFYIADREQYPRNKDGSIDYESPDALDIKLIGKCFNDLMKNGESDLPIFDFNTHSRSERKNSIRLDDDSLIVVEGIHGLNPRITAGLSKDKIAKIYVSVSSRVYTRDNDLVFTRRDLRLMRRMVRDYYFRSTSVDETLDNWQKVCNGENKFIFPFRNHADFKLDSFHPCEVGIISPIVSELFASAGDGAHTDEKNDFIKKIRLCESIDKNIISDESLLREFVV